MYYRYSQGKGRDALSRFNHGGAVIYETQRRLGRRTGFYASQMVGVAPRGGGAVMGFGGASRFAAGLASNTLIDPMMGSLPYDDFLETMTYYSTTSAGLIYSPNPRLSFSGGGGVSFVRRGFKGLPGVNAYSARGDVAYLMGRDHTIGIDYMYTKFHLTRFLDNGDLHGIAFNYSTTLGRTWAFGARAGVFRVEVQRVQQVALDPFVAQILGEPRGLSIVHGVFYGIQGGVALSRSFRRFHQISFSASRSVRPAGTTYVTSRSDAVRTTYGYGGISRVSLSVGAGYTRSSSYTLRNRIGEMYGTHAGVGFNIARGLNMHGGVAIRRTQLDTVSRTSKSVGVGLSFSPGSIPVSFW
jgi:hypothetical protein